LKIPLWKKFVRAVMDRLFVKTIRSGSVGAFMNQQTPVSGNFLPIISQAVCVVDALMIYTKTLALMNNI